ncbi:hypothetical protein A2W24_00725 [Microgenomates group bacterium RBG_16_45_19]|nr:MAG: hypothetical protein A2W24_00725 [Microgenomates group bacterium RBG_16_45_19]
MKWQHQDLANGRWFELNFIEQMGNVGSEVERSIKWKEKGNQEQSWGAVTRFIELIFLTIQDPKNKLKLKEMCQVKELFLDFIIGENQYHQTKEQWQRYFYQFAYAARRGK